MDRQRGLWSAAVVAALGAIVAAVLTVNLNLISDLVPQDWVTEHHVLVWAGAGLMLLISVVLAVIALRAKADPPTTSEVKVVEEIDPLATEFNSEKKRYNELVGRDEELSRVLVALRDEGGLPVVRVVAAGGMGKTALAYEAAYRLRSEGRFEHVVWADAQVRDVFAGHHAEIKISDYDLERLVDDICKQCGRRGLLGGTREARNRGVARLLAARRILVVLENYETVRDELQLHLLLQFAGISGSSRVIVNSRLDFPKPREGEEAIDKPPWPKVTFKGIMRVEDGMQLLRQLGDSEEFPRLKHATESDLEEIFSVTVGVPLIVRLVAAQVEEYGLADAVSNLKHLKPDTREAHALEYAFAFSYNRLSPAARNLLYVICKYQKPVAEAKVQKLSQLPDREYREAIRQLERSLLVDDVSTDLRRRVFDVHLMVRYLVAHKIRATLRDADKNA